MKKLKSPTLTSSDEYVRKNFGRKQWTTIWPSILTFSPSILLPLTWAGENEAAILVCYNTMVQQSRRKSKLVPLGLFAHVDSPSRAAKSLSVLDSSPGHMSDARLKSGSCLSTKGQGI
jgi:hypothetical protein